MIPFPAMIVALVVMFYLIVIRPEQRRKREHTKQLEAIKQNDRVITLGGIYGVVNSVNRDADKIVLKVDEKTGACLTLTFGSIARVIPRDSSDSN